MIKIAHWIKCFGCPKICIERRSRQVVCGLVPDSNKVDIVDVFRPSEEVEEIANQTIKIAANVLWLQLDIQNNKARDLVIKNKIYYVANKCTKIEFERLFRGS